MDVPCWYGFLFEAGGYTDGVGHLIFSEVLSCAAV